MMQTSPSGRRINYPLLSDKTQEASKKYGILNKETGSPFRGTFIIDPEGKIQGVFINPQPVGRNIDEVLRILEALKYTEKTDLPTPSEWKKGDNGVKIGWEYVGKY